MEEAPKKPVVEFVFKPGASLRVKGNFILKGPDGNIIETSDEIKLCRCGKSKNMPFCDHSHRTL